MKRMLRLIQGSGSALGRQVMSYKFLKVLTVVNIEKKSNTTSIEKSIEKMIAALKICEGVKRIKEQQHGWDALRS